MLKTPNSNFFLSFLDRLSPFHFRRSLSSPFSHYPPIDRPWRRFREHSALNLLHSRCSSHLTPLIHRHLSSFASNIADASSSLTIETSIPFADHMIDTPSSSVSTTPAEIFTFSRDMATMRRMELAADSLYKVKLIRGFCHLYDGQEAVSVWMEAAITKKDCIITAAYRNNCIYLGRGGTMVKAFTELMGRSGGCSKGKGGSMHFFIKDSGFYGGHGVVGSSSSVGVWFGIWRLQCMGMEWLTITALFPNYILFNPHGARASSV